MNAHTKPPAEPQEALYRRTDIAPEIFFQALGRVRKEARDEIERLITWLDSTIDVDEDSAVDDDGCDDGELEPSLGSFDRLSNQIKAWESRGWGDVDVELDTSDHEPNLGFSEPILTGNEMGDFGWPYASRDAAQHETTPSESMAGDREGEHDGREPSLCGVTASAVPLIGGAVEDGEQDQEDEPSLGSCNTTHGGTQAFWGYGGTDEREGPDDDLEPNLCGVTVEQGDDRDLEGDDADREPSLGWTIDGVISNTSAEGFDCELYGSAPRDIVEAKLRHRTSRTELRWPDGSPVTAESLRTRPSNVINLNSAAL